MSISISNVLGVCGIITIVVGAVAGILLALGFRMDTPSDVTEAHIEDFHDHEETFEGHVAHIDTFVAQYEAREAVKDSSREQRTRMVEAQAKLNCLKTGADTLVMLDLLDICDDLGVPRR